MKYIISLLALTAALIGSAGAQKLVIGSRVPAIKGDKDVEWLSSAPAKDKAMLIDFFSADNPSCAKEYALLKPIIEQWDTKLDIVIISQGDTPEFRSMVDADGGRYSFALDADGSVFTAYGVRYLPFYMLVNAKGEMIWQGNIATLQLQNFKL